MTGASGPRRRLSDPPPPPPCGQSGAAAAQAATIGIFVILLIAALDLGRAVLLPVVSAFVVTMMLGPLQAHADRYRIPNVLTALTLWLLVIAAFYGLIVLLAAPVVEWIGKAPDIGRNVQDKLHVLDAPARRACAICATRCCRRRSDKGVSVDLLAFVQPVSRSSDAGDRADADLLRHVVLHVARAPPAAPHDGRARSTSAKRGCACSRSLNDIEHNLTGYLSVVTMINAVRRPRRRR